jgi:hypothetical protein
MQPFTLKFLTVVLVFALSWGASLLVPQLTLIPDILLRSAVFSVIFLFLIYVLKISEDIDGLVKRFFRGINS